MRKQYSNLICDLGHLFFQRLCTLATIPDPTHPTDKPTPNDVPIPPKPSGGGGSNAFIWLVGGTAVAVGGWWYTQQSGQDAHAKRKQDEEKIKQKAQELKDAGKATAHDVVREGEQGYDSHKVRPLSD